MTGNSPWSLPPDILKLKTLSRLVTTVTSFTALLQCGGSKWCECDLAGDRRIAFGGERFSGERSFNIGVDGTAFGSVDLLGVVGRGRPFNMIVLLNFFTI
jgi:hypothetical protein